jgi:hypothetical protein
VLAVTAILAAVRPFLDGSRMVRRGVERVAAPTGDAARMQRGPVGSSQADVFFFESGGAMVHDDEQRRGKRQLST